MAGHIEAIALAAWFLTAGGQLATMLIGECFAKRHFSGG